MWEPEAAEIFLGTATARSEMFGATRPYDGACTHCNDTDTVLDVSFEYAYRPRAKDVVREKRGGPTTGAVPLCPSCLAAAERHTVFPLHGWDDWDAIDGIRFR